MRLLDDFTFFLIGIISRFVWLNAAVFAMTAVTYVVMRIVYISLFLFGLYQLAVAVGIRVDVSIN